MFDIVCFILRLYTIQSTLLPKVHTHRISVWVLQALKLMHHFYHYDHTSGAGCTNGLQKDFTEQETTQSAYVLDVSAYVQRTPYTALGFHRCAVCAVVSLGSRTWLSESARSSPTPGGFGSRASVALMTRLLMFGLGMFVYHLPSQWISMDKL